MILSLHDLIDRPRGHCPAPKILGALTVALLFAAACSSSGGGSPTSGVESQAASRSATAAASTTTSATVAPAASLTTASIINSDSAPKCAALVGDPHWLAKLKANQLSCQGADGGYSIAVEITCTGSVKQYEFQDDQIAYFGLSNGPLYKAKEPLNSNAQHKTVVAKCNG